MDPDPTLVDSVIPAMPEQAGRRSAMTPPTPCAAAKSQFGILEIEGHPCGGDLNETVFTQAAFWVLVMFSLVLPLAIFGGLLVRRTVSRGTVLAFGLALVVLAGVDVYLLQVLAAEAKRTLSLADDAVFVSEIATALYLLPALFGGVGVNIVSHVLVRHLAGAEDKFEGAHRAHAERSPGDGRPPDRR